MTLTVLTRSGQARAWAVSLTFVAIVGGPFFMGADLGELRITGIARHDIPLKKYRGYAQEPQFDPVGQVIEEGDVHATFVLIRPQWALTSAHIFPSSGSSDGLDVSGMTFRIGGQTLTADTAIAHPNYQSGDPRTRADLAVVSFSQEAEVEPARLYTGRNEVEKIGSGVGFGRVRTALKTGSAGQNEKLAGQNRIDTIGGTTFGTRFPNNSLGTDFDDPERSSPNPLGTPEALELEYMASGGDSGGGLFIKEEGKWYLAGITERKSAPDGPNDGRGLYGTAQYWVRVSSYVDWIRAATDS